jgi:hypothetical protein
MRLTDNQQGSDAWKPGFRHLIQMFMNNLHPIETNVADGHGYKQYA